MSNKISLKRTVLAQTLALAFMAGMGSVAFAQSNTTGVISGTVEAQAGTTVLIEGLGTGFRRTVTPDAAGKFQALSLPVGEYRVSLVKNGKVERSEEVSVTIGANKEVSFAPARVEVTGRVSRIDVTNTNNGATFTAKELARIPVAANVGAVIQLAPSTVKGDPRYGGSGAPSFGGASASENAYYINGFPVTNPLTQVGFSQLPFFSISQANILSGGYGAEFGRSTGGVVNITTKSGTNNWEAGFIASMTPEWARAKPRNIIYPTNGTIRQYLAGDKTDAYQVSAYAAGPIIKDKLFIFANAEYNRTDAETTRVVNTDPTASTVGWQERKLTIPRSLIKLDWNITDDHHLEYTMVRDRPEDRRKYFGFNYSTLQRNNIQGGEVVYKSYGPTPIAATTGGDVDIIKYTGHFTDDLTMTALYGRTNIDRSQNQIGYNPALPQILVTDGAPGINYVSNQPFTDDTLAPGAKNKQSGYRLDLEYALNQQHTLRAGLDNMKLDSFSGTLTAGGVLWNYQSDACGSQIAAPGAPNVPTNLQSADGKTCYFVASHMFKAVNPAKVDQSAWYLEDKWQVTKNLLVVAGIRNEAFTNYNDIGQAYIKQTRQLEPRLQFAWDVNGDSSTKISGSAGRYHLQMPANVAIRGAGASTFIDQYFSYTGVNPVTGAPTGAVALTVPFSPDGETGNPKDVNYVAAKDLKSHYQDEIALGFEKALSKSLNVGAKVTYRELKSTLEDFCDPRPFLNWAAKNAPTNSLDKFNGTGAFETAGPAFSCTIINPGVTNTWDMDLDGDGKAEHIVLSPTDLGGGASSRDGAAMPKPTRTYIALDFFAEHPFDGKWYGKVNYTWSKSKGNTEGQLNSDLGQADPATTVTYDFKELMEYGNGRLPNDRTHVIKAFGFYNVTPEFSIGGNLLLSSGRPKQCLGKYPDPSNLASQLYGTSLFHYCAPGATPSVGTAVPDPRGARGEMPWESSLDLNVAYKPNWFQGLMFKVDVFNVFNSQTPLQQRDRALPANRFELVEAYSSPRAVKFSVQYDKKF